MKCSNAVPCHAKIIKSKSMQFYENCCTAESCCCRRRRRYSFDVLVHWSKSNNWFDVFTFHYSAYSILPFTFNSLKCAKLFNYCFDSFHSMTQFIRFILRLAIRSCRFIFNFKVGAMHLAFCISIFSLLLLLFVIFHSWSQLNAHRQAHIGAYVRTLFVKVFHNCFNSLRRIQVRVHIFVFRTRLALSIFLFLFIHCTSSWRCVYVYSVLYSSMSAAFVVISLNKMEMVSFKRVQSHALTHIVYILQNSNSMLKIVVILKLEMKQSLFQKLF